GGEADYLLFADGKAIATVEANLRGIRLPALKGSPASTPQVFWIFIPGGAIHCHFVTKAPVPRPVSVTGSTRILLAVACSRFTDPRHSKNGPRRPHRRICRAQPSDTNQDLSPRRCSRGSGKVLGDSSFPRKWQPTAAAITFRTL